MRLRNGLFVALTVVGISVAGCGGAEEKTPPPGTDTDTPTLDIDTGDLSAPDSETPDEGDE